MCHEGGIPALGVFLPARTGGAKHRMVVGVLLPQFHHIRGLRVAKSAGAVSCRQGYSARSDGFPQAFASPSVQRSAATRAPRRRYFSRARGAWRCPSPRVPRLRHRGIAGRRRAYQRLRRERITVA